MTMSDRGMKYATGREAKGLWWGHVEHRLKKGPKDVIYTDDGLDPRKTKSLAPGEKIWCPRGGDMGRPKIKEAADLHGTRKRLTKEKRAYLKTFPSATKVAAAQANKPAKYQATMTNRPLVVNAPG